MQNCIKAFATFAVLGSMVFATPAIAKPPASSNPATASDLSVAFEALHTETVWPVVGATRDDIESTFGPRIKASTNAYDWHRGIDVDAPLGSPVVAAASGQLADIVTFENGGLTVILKHSFKDPVVFQGVTTSAYYSLSMHLDSVDPELQAAFNRGERPFIAAGQFVGTVGHSGTALGDHLHFEVRVGTRCSLEYQLANPTAACALGFGYDPAVHPLLMFSSLPDNLAMTRLSGGVRLTTSDDQPDINRVEVKITDRRQTIANHVLDLNLRGGFDATSTAALDTPDTSKPYFSPETFGDTSTTYQTRLVIPASFGAAPAGKTYKTTVTVTDIWGNAKIISW